MVKSDEEIELEIKLGNARARCRDLERQRDELVAECEGYPKAILRLQGIIDRQTEKLDEADKAEAELDALKAELKHESELTATMTKKIARLEEAGVVLASSYSVIADMSRPGARAVLEDWRAALKGEQTDE